MKTNNKQLKNERDTEDIVRSHLKKDKLFSSVIFEEQRSSTPK